MTPSNSQNILLTGITGALGSWLAAEILKSGVRITSLIRGENKQDCSQRLDAVLQTVEASAYRNSVNIISGDILQEHFGLSDDLHFEGGLDAVLHCAACTAFEESASELIRHTNINGTRHALQIAEQYEAAFIHVSTAYVAGCRRGTVYETELETRQDFHNEYERSKYEAERMAQAWAHRTGLPLIVLRPSIVIGHSQHGRAVRFNTMYDMMHAFDVFSGKLGDKPFRAAAQRDAEINMIPVDYFARAAWSIIQHNRPGTYHIANPNPPTMEELKEHFKSLFGVENLQLVDEADFERKKPSRAERFYQKATSVYQPYVMASHPFFDQTQTDAILQQTNITLPPMDLSYFERLLQYARSVNWGKNSEAVDHKVQPEIEDISGYFNTFLQDKINQRLLPNLHSLCATFRIAIEETPKTPWTLCIEKGALKSISRNGLVPECSFLLNQETFREIVAGRLAPQKAFFTRRAEIEGNIETGLKLASVLAEFFRLYPYEAGNTQ